MHSVGAVSAALCALRPGEEVGLRISPTSRTYTMANCPGAKDPSASSPTGVSVRLTVSAVSRNRRLTL